MRLIPFLAVVIVLTVAAALCLACVPAHGSDCCSPACSCGCNDGQGCRCLTWTVVPDTGGDQVGLWHGSKLLGIWRVGDQTYHVRTAPGAFAAAGELPAAAPALPERYRRVTNYGTEPDPGGPRGWTICGQPVSADEAHNALAGGPALPDDSGRPYVLWVGDDATGQRVKADVGDRARVQSVPPGHWMTADRDGRPIYAPGLWFVRADGKAVGHEVSYTGAPQLAEGLRRCAPDWKPDAVPDLTPPAPAPLLPSLPAIAPAVAMPGALASGGLLSSIGIVLYRRLRSRPS
jgi:hypothetical protein